MKKFKIKVPAFEIEVLSEEDISNVVVPVVDQPTIEEPPVADQPIVVTPPTVTPSPVQETKPPIIEVGREVIDLSENFVGRNDIKLESGKHYKAGLIKSQMLLNRNVKIYSDNPENRPILEFGVKNYSPQVHGKQKGFLFLMADNSSLLIDNVNICQDKQLSTVETFNPRIINGIQQPQATWTVAVRNCDTTALGNNGGFGLGFLYGSPKENHAGLINFKHFCTGLMDAKNPYQDGIMYVTLRDVECYARADARLNFNNFEHIGTLQDNVLTFDGDVFSLTSGYNWTWMDNDAYIVLYDRYTFFLDGYNADTIVSQNQFKIRPQAEGKCMVGVLSSKVIYSDVIELHAGDQFEYKGEYYTIVSKDRINYPWFDDRTREAKAEPLKSRALVYELDKVLNTADQLIEIDYKGDKIEFTNKPITLLYKANGGFKTTINSKYREQGMLNSRGIGHLSYNHSDISMDAVNVKHYGFYRGSEKGQGKSLIWNLYNCEGFEDSGVWFNPALPVTNKPDLPIHPRIASLLQR